MYFGYKKTLFFSLDTSIAQIALINDCLFSALFLSMNMTFNKSSHRNPKMVKNNGRDIVCDVYNSGSLKQPAKENRVVAHGKLPKIGKACLE